MYRRCFKSFLCFVLIIALCLSFTVPAFASSPAWYEDFIDGLPVPSVPAPDFLTGSVSDIVYFGSYKTALLAEARLAVGAVLQGSSSDDPFVALAYRGLFEQCFTTVFSTTQDLDYVYVSLDALTKFVKDLSAYYPLELSYMPGTRCYCVVLTESGIRGPDPESAVNRLYVWDGMRAANGGAEAVEGAALRAIPYLGNKILVAPASGQEPDFFPSEDKTNSSATTGHNYYTDSSYTDNSVTDNSVKQETTIYESGDTYYTETFDYSNGTWYDNVTGTINDIESLHYNPVTNTYTVNNTYNITYEYNYTYYYNLGSSENLVQDYKFYYELPDGRSSSDLTADEIAGLSLEFDVVNYAQDRTDENTKVLVPFNGSWEDTAYNGPELRWVRGASITYKESAAFEGAMYMDGNTTSCFGFNAVANVSKIPTQGYTIQFRYYADALNSNTSAQYWPLLVAPFGVGQSTTLDISVVPWFWIGPDGYIYFKAKSGGALYYNNDNSGATRIGKVTAGSWNDVTVSFVPVNSTTLQVNFFINGVLQTSRPQFQATNFDNWAKYDKTFYPFFAWNVQSFVFYMTTNLETMFNNLQLGLYEQNGPYQMIDNLRVVDFALYDGSSNFVPTPVPFDTNLVYVLPDTTNLKDNTIAVQSGVPVSGYRIGGVRPTFPDKGMVWMPLENDKIADCQIYNGSYWESVGCRVWTGQRWVPAWAFNVVTLSDLWDIYGGEDTDNYTEITAGSFYQWFQQHFLELKTGLIDRLDRILEAMGVQVEGEEDITKPDGDGNAKFSLLQLVDRILAGVTKVPASVLSSALGSISETVGGFVTGITDFFGGVEDMGEQSEPFFESMDGVLGNASQLVHDTWEAIPEDAQDVLTTCFMLAVFGSCIVIFLG